jgi:hypothetical protein
VKEKVRQDYDLNTLYICMKLELWNVLNWFKGRMGARKNNRRGEFGESALYTCIEISQWN